MWSVVTNDGSYYADVELITSGYIDEAAAEASCGLEYTDALKGKLADIVFADGKVSFGESGGGSEPTKTYWIPEQTFTAVNDKKNWIATLNVSAWSEPYPTELTVSFDGVIYECPDRGTQAYGDRSFANYPFFIRYYSSEQRCDITVADDDPHTISAYTIEESGGGGGVEVFDHFHVVCNNALGGGSVFQINNGTLIFVPIQGLDTFDAVGGYYAFGNDFVGTVEISLGGYLSTAPSIDDSRTNCTAFIATNEGIRGGTATLTAFAAVLDGNTGNVESLVDAPVIYINN
jgi:hypothetical protein